MIAYQQHLSLLASFLYLYHHAEQLFQTMPANDKLLLGEGVMMFP